MFIIDQVIAAHYPILNQHKVNGPIIKSLLQYLVHKQDFLDFAEKKYPHLREMAEPLLVP